MSKECIGSANDDGVRYEDGDVVYGGSAPESADNQEIMTHWSPALCDVPTASSVLAPRSLTNPSRIKDSDDAAQLDRIGRAISDIDDYIDGNYPAYLS